MAVSLAACGGSSTTDDTDDTDDTTPVAPTNQAFSLTIAADSITGGAGNDTINGTTLASWSISDTVDGGAGTDTMTVYVSGTAVPTNSTVNNVEVLNIISTGAGYTIDTSSATNYVGLTTLSVEAAAGGAITITTKSDATSVSTVGGAAVNVTDSGTTDTLASVSVLSAGGAIAVASDVLTSLTLDTTGAQNATVTAAAGTRSINITIDGATAGTITDDTATTVTYTASGANSAVTALSNAAATTVNFAGDKTLTSSGETFTAATSIVSTNSAGVSLGTALGTGVTFTGGAGNDTITIGATTKAITMGAGDDSVTVGSALGTAGSLDGGTGTDTLSMAAADAITATASASAEASLAGRVSGFEALTVGTTAASGQINMNRLDNIAVVNVGDVANGQTLTLAGVASGFRLNADVGTTGTGGVAAALLVDGTADTLVLGISASAAKDLQALTANGFEALTILSDDTATSPAGNFQHVISALTAGSVTAITISGDAGFNLAYTGTTLTVLDASGMTSGADLTWTAGALAGASTVSGSASGTNTIDLSTASAVVTYTGGTGNDVIANTNDLNNIYTLGNGANSINTGGASGNGNNTVTGGTGVDTIKLGTGNNNITTLGGDDVIIVGSGNNTINAGEGADSITVGAGLNTVTTGAGADTVTISAVSSNANVFTTITDIAVGDKIQVIDQGTPTSSPLGAAIQLASTATLADYKNTAVAAADATTHANVEWFQFGGNTYIVVDYNDGAGGDTVGFDVGEDMFICLTGTIDLSASTLSAAGLITVV